MQKEYLIYLVSTDKHSNLYILSHQHRKPVLAYNKNKVEKYICGDLTYNDQLPQHLYIVSDKEIKEGDWVINNLDKSIGRAERKPSAFEAMDKEYSKIIATTNPELNAKVIGFKSVTENVHYSDYNVAKIDEQWIKDVYIPAYNSGSPITKVMLEYDSIPADRAPNGWDTFLKLSNGNVIIHPVEERTFTMKEAEEIFNAARDRINHPD